MKQIPRQATLWLLAGLVSTASTVFAQSGPSVVEPGATLVKVGGDYQFTEGPAPDPAGDVLFTDVRASRIYRWSPDGEVKLFRENSGSANGLALDRAGNLLVCEGGRGRVVTIDREGHVTVVADQYQGKPFNQPNDLWVDSHGGVYFSDPIYGRAEMRQDGEHVYYVSPDRKRVLRAVDDLVRPNGLVGTPDGKLLYISDHGAKKIYAYAIQPDGTLSQKRLFAPIGADGMTLDSEGNLYLAEKGIVVYDATGRRRETIGVPEQTTNVCFGGTDRRTLFITARPAVYALPMRVPGVPLAPPVRESDK